MVRRTWIFSAQMLVLVMIYHLGNFIAHFFQLRIPGNVIGLMFLLGLLWMKVIKVEQIEIAAGWLMKHLGFFFIPVSVGCMTIGPVIIKNGVSLLILLFISAFIGLIAAGKVTQSVMKRKEEVKVNARDHAI